MKLREEYAKFKAGLPATSITYEQWLEQQINELEIQAGEFELRDREAIAILEYFIADFNCGNLQKIKSQKMDGGDYYSFEQEDGVLKLNKH